eukprot:6212135-Pleurochrysis_carterae.AAC.2
MLVTLKAEMLCIPPARYSFYVLDALVRDILEMDNIKSARRYSAMFMALCLCKPYITKGIQHTSFYSLRYYLSFCIVLIRSEIASQTLLATPIAILATHTTSTKFDKCRNSPYGTGSGANLVQHWAHGDNQHVSVKAGTPVVARGTGGSLA